MTTGAHHSMLEAALTQLDAVAERIKLEPGIHKRLSEIMNAAFQRVRALSREEGVDLRTSALMLGVSRVAEAKRLRGLYP